MPENVIVNTSPIFYLHRLRLLELLHKFYGTIIVPVAVINELGQGKAQGVDVPDLDNLCWIKTQRVKISKFLKLVPDLGPGEAEVLTLGLENPSSLIIIDDLLARRIADLQKLRFTGTAGIIVKAKREGHISSVSDVITELANLGFHINDRLRRNVLRLANETIS